MRFLIGVVVLLLPLISAANVADSVGFEKVNGKVLVLHEVEHNETLFGLSKKYGVQMDEILKYNPGIKSGLTEGEIIRVPYRKKTKLQKGPGTHTVHAGETLFFISRLYEVTVDEIKEWNGLTSNSIEPGQKLVIKESEAVPKDYTVTAPPPEYVENSNSLVYHIVTSGETLYSISRSEEVSVDSLREWNDLAGSGIHIGQQLIVGRVELADVTTNTTTQVASKPTEEKPPEEVVYLNADHSRKYRDIVIDDTGFATKTESGLAEVINGTGDSRKFLALHRSLPVGTILMVKNEMNNEIVFVRVLGKLPDTGSNENIVIKISKAAYDRLKGVGQRFRVQLSYIPLEETNGL